MAIILILRGQPHISYFTIYHDKAWWCPNFQNIFLSNFTKKLHIGLKWWESNLNFLQTLSLFKSTSSYHTVLGNWRWSFSVLTKWPCVHQHTIIYHQSRLVHTFTDNVTWYCTSSQILAIIYILNFHVIAFKYWDFYPNIGGHKLSQ